MTHNESDHDIPTAAMFYLIHSDGTQSEFAAYYDAARELRPGDRIQSTEGKQ